MKRFLTASLLLSCFATAALAAAMSLSNVRKVYIEKMPDNLDQYLASSISKKFHGSLTIVLNRGEADGILRGVNIGAQTTDKATVELVDPGEHEVLWSGTAGDRGWKTLEVKHNGKEQIADHLIGELRKAMQR